MKGSSAGLADQPCGHTSLTLPVSAASQLSLAAVKRSEHVGARGGAQPVRVQVGHRG